MLKETEEKKDQHGKLKFNKYNRQPKFSRLRKKRKEVIFSMLLLLAAQWCSKLFVTPWTVAHQAPSSMGFSRQEYRNGLPFPFAGDLPDSGIKPRSLASQ